MPDFLLILALMIVKYLYDQLPKKHFLRALTAALIWTWVISVAVIYTIIVGFWLIIGMAY